MPAKPKYSPQLHDAFLVALDATGGFVEPACAIARIPSSTMWYWLERGKSGDERYAKLWGDVIEARAQRQVILKRLVDAHATEDAATARWMLERIAPKEYGLHEKVAQAAAEQLQAWLDAVMGHLDEATRDRLLAAVSIVTGHAPSLDAEAEGGEEEVIDAEGESVSTGPRRLTDGSAD